MEWFDSIEEALAQPGSRTSRQRAFAPGDRARFRVGGVGERRVSLLLFARSRRATTKR
jgi:hypothetical protein